MLLVPHHIQLMLDSAKFSSYVVKMPCALALRKRTYHYPYSNDDKEYAVVVVFIHVTFPFYLTQSDNHYLSLENRKYYNP